MNVKNIDKFIKDIDEERILDWRIEPDCHPKVKKIVLTTEKILQEKKGERTIQITLERSQRERHRLGHRPRKRWEFSIDLDESKVLNEEIIKDITSKFYKTKLEGHPILFDGHFYFENDRCYK